MKKWFKRFFYVVLIFLLIWLVLAQGCMNMRTSDKDAAVEFNKHSVAYHSYYYKAGKRNIHYVQSGIDTMPTLIFIHGSPGSWDAFEEYLLDSQLLLHYRMISIDRPGFGYSDFGNVMNLSDQTKVLSEVLKHVQNGKPMALIGHSLGGPIVIKLAAENPSLPISNLVVLAGAVDPAEEKPESWRATLDRTPLRYFVPGAMRPSNAELLLFKQDVYDLKDDFPKVTCHVILMHGTVDDFVPPVNAVYSQTHLIHANGIEMIWFQGQRHFIPWTKFTEIRDTLLRLKM